MSDIVTIPGRKLKAMQQHATQLEAKLEIIERLANEPIAYCAYPGYEKDDALSRLTRIREALGG